MISVQDPIRLIDSEPEPDVALLLPRADFYVSGKPRPADILLLIEVSDSSLEYDRLVKLPMYAEAGIAEFWIVNLEDDCLEVYRQPTAGGVYNEVRSCDGARTLRSPRCRDRQLAVDDIL